MENLQSIDWAGLYGQLSERSASVAVAVRGGCEAGAELSLQRLEQLSGYAASLTPAQRRALAIGALTSAVLVPCAMQSCRRPPARSAGRGARLEEVTTEVAVPPGDKPATNTGAAAPAAGGKKEDRAPPEEVPEAEAGGGRFRVVGKALVRCGFASDSGRLGFLEPGAVIEVLAMRTTTSGGVRIQFERGWVSAVAGGGNQLLARMSEGDELAHLEEREYVAGLLKTTAALEQTCLQLAARPDPPSPQQLAPELRTAIESVMRTSLALESGSIGAQSQLVDLQGQVQMAAEERERTRKLVGELLQCNLALEQCCTAQALAEATAAAAAAPDDLRVPVEPDAPAAAPSGPTLVERLALEQVAAALQQVDDLVQANLQVCLSARVARLPPQRFR